MDGAPHHTMHSLSAVCMHRQKGPYGTVCKAAHKRAPEALMSLMRHLCLRLPRPGQPHHEQSCSHAGIQGGGGGGGGGARTEQCKPGLSSFRRQGEQGGGMTPLP